MLQKLKGFIEEKRLNFYDLAVMTDDGIESSKLQPCNNCNDSYSIAKAFTMTGIGLLADQGLVRAEDRLADILRDQLSEGIDPKWEDVTIEHVLKHRWGNGTDFFDIDNNDANDYGTDYLGFILRHPLAYRPGSVYVYNDAGFYLLGRAIHALSGETMDQFLMKRLTAPLHFSEVAWSLCPHGHPIAGTGLYVQAKDMVKLAWLYQNGGVYEGRRILSEEWINQVIDRQYELAPLREGSQWIGKAGMNGQMICFSAQKRIAVAWHSYEPNQGDKLFIDYLHEISE